MAGLLNFDLLKTPFKTKTIYIISYSLGVIFSSAPLFSNHYFKQNVYLTWLGAYRIAEGHLPYVDFGIPMGPGFFIIPALIFKAIGPSIFNLVIAQFLINILFIIVIIKILRFGNVSSSFILLSVVFLSVVFIPLNYWPWYNHSVIFYQLISLLFFLLSLFTRSKNTFLPILYISLAGIFSFFSFITKQDAGAMNFMILTFLLIYYTFVSKNFLRISIFLVFSLGCSYLFFSILRPYNVLYWFNFGQAPHFSRINTHDLIKDFILDSMWIKLYLTIGLIYTIYNFFYRKQFLLKECLQKNIYSLLVIAILVEAAVFQVTSYNPPNSNIFFHAFGISLIGLIYQDLYGQPNRLKVLIATLAIPFIFSMNFWDPTKSVLKSVFKINLTPPPRTVVSKDNYFANKGDTLKSQLRFELATNFKTLNHIKLPEDLIDGLQNLMNHPTLRNNQELRVLNMSELTFLAEELNYQIPKNSEEPLFYHVGVGMFEKEVDFYKNKVIQHDYDLIIFETIPYWENYFPKEVRDEIIKEYDLLDRFRGPKGFPNTYVEIYIKKENRN